MSSPKVTKMSKQQEETRDKGNLGKIKQFFATVCLGPITIGASIAWTSPVLPQLENLNSTATSLHLTTEEGSWVGSMLALGALSSAIPAGYLADKFGPKRCIIAFVIPVLIFTLAVILADDVATLCAGRFFYGIATGGICVVAPMYISEISDVSLRGTLSSFFELLVYVGIVITAIIGAYMHYITLTVILGFLALVFGIIFIFLPESPTYLMKMRKREQAEKALRFYRSKQYNIAEVLDEINDVLYSRPQHKAHVGEIWKSKAAIRGFIACVGLMSFQQMSGVDGITFYNVQIFQAAGAVLNPYTSSIIIAFIQLAAAGVVVLIAEKTNRRTLLYVSSIGTCVCLALFGLYFTLTEYNVKFVGLGFLPLISMIFYTISFAMGLGPIPWMINGELFSPEIKGLANGITIATGWILLFMITKTMPIMMEDWGTHYTFYTYSVFMAGCIIFVKYCVPETRGKSLEQIQNELKA